MHFILVPSPYRQWCGSVSGIIVSDPNPARYTTCDQIWYGNLNIFGKFILKADHFFFDYIHIFLENIKDAKKSLAVVQLCTLCQLFIWPSFWGKDRKMGWIPANEDKISIKTLPASWCLCCNYCQNSACLIHNYRNEGPLWVEGGNAEIGTERPGPEKEYINGIFVAVYSQKWAFRRCKKTDVDLVKSTPSFAGYHSNV